MVLMQIKNMVLYTDWKFYLKENRPDLKSYEIRTHALFNSNQGLRVPSVGK